jgi:hypothetical protein
MTVQNTKKRTRTKKDEEQPKVEKAVEAPVPEPVRSEPEYDTPFGYYMHRMRRESSK